MRFWSLEGITSYEEVRELQLKLVELRASGAEIVTDGGPGAISGSRPVGSEDIVLFLEHAPVITRGRGLQFTGKPGPRQMPAPTLLPPGMAFAESERGGDLTYHGPGQLVIYPVCKLDGSGFGPNHDVSGFIRNLEQVLIDEIAAAGVRASREECATGVWVERVVRGSVDPAQGKVASIGIAVRKWVTYHGLAVNVVNELEPFHLISPCGFQPEVMTRLRDLPGFAWATESGWREELEARLARRILALASQSGDSSSAKHEAWAGKAAASPVERYGDPVIERRTCAEWMRALS